MGHEDSDRKPLFKVCLKSLDTHIIGQLGDTTWTGLSWLFQRTLWYLLWDSWKGWPNHLLKNFAFCQSLPQVQRPILTVPVVTIWKAKRTCSDKDQRLWALNEFWEDLSHLIQQVAYQNLDLKCETLLERFPHSVHLSLEVADVPVD